MFQSLLFSVLSFFLFCTPVQAQEWPAAEWEEKVELVPLIATVEGREIRGISGDDVGAGVYAPPASKVTLKPDTPLQLKIEIEKKGGRIDITKNSATAYRVIGNSIEVTPEGLVSVKKRGDVQGETLGSGNDSAVIVQYLEPVRDKGGQALTREGTVYVYFSISALAPSEKKD